MATISTKPVGTTQPATQPVEAVKTEKSKASEATSSSIASLAKSETQPAKKSCWQQVKDCCAKVLAWIKEHILCCFFKKDEAKIEQEKKAKEAKEKEQAEKKKAEEDKAKFTKWFNSLTPEQQKECNEGLKQFAAKVSTNKTSLEEKVKELPKEAGEIIANVKNRNWVAVREEFAKDPLFVMERLIAGISASFMMDYFEKNPKVLETYLETSLELAVPAIQIQLELNGAIGFLNTLQTGDPKLSPIQLRMVFSNLSSKDRFVLLQSYKTATEKTDFTEEQFLAVLEKGKDESLKKWIDAFIAGKAPLADNKILQKKWEENEKKTFEQIKAAFESQASTIQSQDGAKG